MDIIDDIADRLTAAVEAGDRDALGALYADDVVVWHNTDRVELTKEQSLTGLDRLVAVTSSRQYRDIRRYHIDGGFVQQHLLHLEFATGSGDLPGCVVVKVDGGEITRIDEYLDGATMASFAG